VLVLFVATRTRTILAGPLALGPSDPCERRSYHGVLFPSECAHQLEPGLLQIIARGRVSLKAKLTKEWEVGGSVVSALLSH